MGKYLNYFKYFFLLNISLRSNKMKTKVSHKAKIISFLWVMIKESIDLWRKFHVSRKEIIKKSSNKKHLEAQMSITMMKKQKHVMRSLLHCKCHNDIHLKMKNSHLIKIKLFMLSSHMSQHQTRQIINLLYEYAKYK